jgi:DHA1 family bicyclomycin/chloramphenicol resistance-like MFS transporter
MKAQPGRVEFIALMAAMSALDAFSIDSMLPALGQISSDLNITVDNQRQYVITLLFAGFSVGVLLYGFVADQIGRRLPTLAGFAIYCIGSLVCIFAESFSVLLIGRALQGLGAAGPYVLAMAIVRDRYSGDNMAQILSLIMMVFIGVPMIAPFVGQGILLLTGWRGIFVCLMLFALVSMLWFWVRMPETLASDNRTRVNIGNIRFAFAQVLGTRRSCSYLFAMGAIFGAFLAYLGTSQQVFQEIYSLGQWFPLVFASLATTFGIASWVNSRLVVTFGAQTLVIRTLATLTLLSMVYGATSVFWDNPPLWSHILYIATIMSGCALLFGNMTTLALEPMGHIAGAASSVVNAGGSLIAIPVATLIGAQLSDNAYPVAIGFAICNLIALLLCLYDARRPLTDVPAAS